MFSSVRVPKTLRYGIALLLLVVSKEHATTTFTLPHDSVKSWQVWFYNRRSRSPNQNQRAL